jgi:hypothetical protein
MRHGKAHICTSLEGKGPYLRVSSASAEPSTSTFSNTDASPLLLPPPAGPLLLLLLPPAPAAAAGAEGRGVAGVRVHASPAQANCMRQ